MQRLSYFQKQLEVIWTPYVEFQFFSWFIFLMAYSHFFYYPSLNIYVTNYILTSIIDLYCKSTTETDYLIETRITVNS